MLLEYLVKLHCFLTTLQKSRKILLTNKAVCSSQTENKTHIEGLSVGLQVSITDIIKAHRHIGITNKVSREQEII